MIDDDAAGDGELARGCEGSVKKKVVIKTRRMMTHALYLKWWPIEWPVIWYFMPFIYAWIKLIPMLKSLMRSDEILLRDEYMNRFEYYLLVVMWKWLGTFKIISKKLKSPCCLFFILPIQLKTVGFYNFVDRIEYAGG